jgi:hypothetical protein
MFGCHAIFLGRSLCDKQAEASSVVGPLQSKWPNYSVTFITDPIKDDF